ncbi:Do family serine endopeptidase [Rhodothermus profundi]|uniref:Do/DeqQ family serine protease n=1 Tax=Rhodothermus profundi TaxID=633813 RepID=A0A1M6QJ11_9BACT|nr:Do family serine endopeptidase [Rhodothermus profundi]SHK20269.1 Do/DeqQ family serine protease [Rhodothermus profundi]
MAEKGRSRVLLLAGGIGLLLIGLLAGILLMEWRFQKAQLATPPVRIVERVQLGGGETVGTVTLSAEDGQKLALDPVVLNQVFREVARRVTPAVVYIEVTVGRSGSFSGDFFHRFDPDQERFFREFMPRQSVGSGVIISPDGYIVTNYHVVEDAREMRVTLADKRQFEARLIGFDRSTDLAVIKIDPPEGETLPVIAFGNSDELTVGEWVLAVGNPFRLTSTVTAGIVSALGRQVNIIDDFFRVEDFIQTDAAINPGNSGGALVNLRGELVGINTAIATESGAYEGYGFAVPVNLVARVVEDLIAYGEVQRGYLGVSIQEVNAQQARELGLPGVQGVLIAEVRRGGAADQAGVREGDVVLAVNGRAVNAPNELQSVVARYRPGDRLELEIWRQGQRLHLQVELMGRDAPAYQEWFSELTEEAPPRMPELTPETPPDGVFKLENWGVGLRELTASERTAFDVDHGVYVAYVARGSVADRAGLPRDVVIVQIEGIDVTALEDALLLLEELAGAETVLFRVKKRDGTVAFYEVPVPVLSEQ